MRLFVGIDLPGAVERKLSDVVSQLAATVGKGGIRWSRPENLHITTKFVGEWPEERLDGMKTALRGLMGRGAINIKLAGLGWFPNPHQPRIFWVGVQAGQELGLLAKATDDAAAAIGVPKEDKEFRPHLTLARLNGATREDIVALRQGVAAIDDLEFGSFCADAFYLYLSKTGGNGSVYTKLESFAL
jgi:2'-5' RNA ligase